MSDDIDSFDVGGEGAQSPDLLAALRGHIDEGIKLEEAIEQLEEDLSAAKKALQAIRTGRLPDLMAQLQTDSITHAGWVCGVDDFVSGNLPKEPEQRQAAIQHLIDTGHDDLLKTSVITEFGRSGHNEAMDLAAQIREQGHSVEVQQGVHTQTLLKFARDAIANGEQIDLQKLGLFTGKVAKLKKAKEKPAPKGRSK